MIEKQAPTTTKKNIRSKYRNILIQWYDYCNYGNVHQKEAHTHQFIDLHATYFLRLFARQAIHRTCNIYPSDMYHMGTYRTVRGPLFSSRPTVSITILVYTCLWWGVQSKLALFKSTKIQILGCLTTKDNKNSWEVFFQFLPCLFFFIFW